MAGESLGTVILKLLVDNKEFAEGLKNAINLVSLSSRQMKDLMELKIERPDFGALDLELKMNQDRLAELQTSLQKDQEETKKTGEEKVRAGAATSQFSDIMQRTFFTIQGGLSVYNLLRSSVGLLIREANEGAIAQNKLSFATRDMEAAAPGAAQRLTEYAAAIRDKTGFEKDSIITAEANLAATFKDEAAVRRLIPLIIDITAFKKQQGEAGADLTSVTQAITKAVQGEEGALSRLGIKLDEGIVKSGDVDAIVKELTKTYGGFAAQQDQNVVAQAVFNDQLKDTQQEIGNIIVRALVPITKPLGEMLKLFSDLPAPIQSATVAFVGLEIALATLNRTGKATPLVLVSLVAGLAGLVGVFDSTGDAASGSAEEIEKAQKELEEFKAEVDRLTPAQIEIHAGDTESEINKIKSRIDELNDSVILGFFVGPDAVESSEELGRLEARLEKLQESLGILRGARKPTVPIVSPQEAQTIVQIDSAIEKLRKTQLTQSGEALGQTNREIAALELKKQRLIELGTDEAVKREVTILEKRLQLGQITKDQFNEELESLKSLAREDETRSEISLKQKQTTSDIITERVKELDTLKQSKQVTIDKYIEELRAIDRTKLTAEQRVEIEGKITTAITERAKIEEESVARSHQVRIKSITDRFARERSEVNEQLRIELEKEQKVLDSVASTDEQKKRAEENIRVLKETSIRDLAGIDVRESIALVSRKVENENRLFQIRQEFLEGTFQAELEAINNKYAEAERAAQDVYAADLARISGKTEEEVRGILLTAETELAAQEALAGNDQAKQTEIAKARANLETLLQRLGIARVNAVADATRANDLRAIQALQTRLGQVQSIVSDIGALAKAGLGEAGAEFVARLQEAFGVVNAIINIIAVIGKLSSPLPFHRGGFTGPGPASEPAGVVHRGEVVFEEPIVRNNLRELLTLRSLMQTGKSAKELVGFQRGGLVGEADPEPDFQPIFDYIRDSAAPAADRLKRTIEEAHQKSELFKAVETNKSLNYNKSDLRKVFELVRTSKEEAYATQIREQLISIIDESIGFTYDASGVPLAVPHAQRDDIVFDGHFIDKWLMTLLIFKQIIQGNRQHEFASLATGGFTGTGPADQVAGVVHGGEVVFEAPIVRNNKEALLALRHILQGNQITVGEIMRGKRDDGSELPEFSRGGFVGSLAVPIRALAGPLTPAYQSGGFVQEFLEEAARISAGQLPGIPAGLVEAARDKGISRDEFNVLIDEVRRLREELKANTEQTRGVGDKVDNIKLKIPPTIEVKATGREIKRVIRTDDESTQ